MKKDQNDHPGSNALRRRDFLIGAGQLTAGLTLAPALLESAFAQTTVKGKEKLIVRSIRPEDLETPVSLLNTWITPNDLFYVRHHMYAAKVDVNEWKLTVGGEVQNPITLTLDELKRAPKHAVTVTLECAGNGRGRHCPIRRGASGRHFEKSRREAHGPIRRDERRGQTGWQDARLRPQRSDQESSRRRHNSRLRDERRGPADPAWLPAARSRVRLGRRILGQMAH
jgi:DMSO/TMAO reductase YedYZ molybdopterin-dependent catalytic subunit